MNEWFTSHQFDIENTYVNNTESVWQDLGISKTSVIVFFLSIALFFLHTPSI